MTSGGMCGFYLTTLPSQNIFWYLGYQDTPLLPRLLMSWREGEFDQQFSTLHGAHKNIDFTIFIIIAFKTNVMIFSITSYKELFFGLLTKKQNAAFFMYGHSILLRAALAIFFISPTRSTNPQPIYRNSFVRYSSV